MELPPSSSTAGSAKLRLMCSYGGHIVPRPGGHNKSFCYVGGDTRIVSVDRRTITTLDLLVSHLSATLSVGFSFTLKYQLPHLDLNSLISLTSDEDFQILVDEYDRLCSPPPSAAPSRIRLFLFPPYKVHGSGRPVIRHPKTESWFFDALKSARILQKGLGEAHGFGFCYGSGVEAHGFVSSGPDTMVIESSSSLGSTSSSASLTNLPWKSHSTNEDNDFAFQDGKAKLIQSNTFPSDDSGSNIVPHHYYQNISYQDPITVQASSVEARACCNTETIIVSETANGSNMVEVVGCNNTSFPHLNQQVVQRRQQQHVHQFVPLLQHTTYHHPHTTYLLPYAQMIPANTTLPITASSYSSLMASQNYCYNHGPPSSATSSSSSSYVNKRHGEVDVPQIMCVQSQNVAVTNTESAEHGGGAGDLDEHDLIYKSQPPPPSSLPISQNRT